MTPALCECGEVASEAGLGCSDCLGMPWHPALCSEACQAEHERAFHPHRVAEREGERREDARHHGEE